MTARTTREDSMSEAIKQAGDALTAVAAYPEIRQYIGTVLHDQIREALAALSAEQPKPVAWAALQLQWEEVGKHHIYGTDGCAFARFGNLDHSVGPAGFNVYQNYDGWQATFWHGNRGHSVGVYPAKDDAKAAAQARANEIVKSIASPIAAPAQEGKK